jgi:hypothetical protein
MFAAVHESVMGPLRQIARSAKALNLRQLSKCFGNNMPILAVRILSSTATRMSRFALAHPSSKSKNLAGLTRDLEGTPAGYFERPKYLRSGGGWSFLDGMSLPSTLI